MIKVFNGRYGLVVTNMLKQVSGDVLKYNEQLAKFVSLEDAMKLQKENLNNIRKNFQVEYEALMSPQQNLTKSLVDNTMGTLGTFMGKINSMDGFLGGFTQSLISGAIAVSALTLKIIGGTIALTSLISMSGGITAFTTTFLGLGTAIKTLFMTTIPSAIKATTVALMANPWILLGIAITSVVAALFMMGAKNKELNKENRELTVGIWKTTTQISSLEAQIKSVNETIVQTKVTNMVEEFSKLGDALGSVQSEIDGVIEKFEKYRQLQEQSIDFSKFEVDMDTQKIISEFESKNKHLMEELKKRGENITEQELIKLSESQINRYVDDSTSLLGMSTKKTNEFLKDYKDYNEAVMKRSQSQLEYLQKVSELEGERISAMKDAFESSNQDIVTQVQTLMQNSEAGNLTDFLEEVKQYGEVSTSYVNGLISAEKLLGKQIKLNQLTQGNGLILLSELNDLNIKLMDIEKQRAVIQTEMAKTEAEGLQLMSNVLKYQQGLISLQALEKETLRYKESYALRIQNLLNIGVKKEKEKKDNAFAILSITKQYELAQAKVLNLGQSELNSIIAKRQELEKTYKIQKDLDQLEMRNKYKDVFGRSKDITDFSIAKLKEMRDEFQSDINKANTSYINGTIGESLEDTLKGKEEMAKLLDSYIAKWVEFDNSIKESNYEERQRKQQMVEESKTLTSFLNEQKLAEMDILNINLELAKLAGVSSAKEQELAWLKEKYNLEKSILETQLKGYRPVDELSIANPTKNNLSQKDLQKANLQSYTGTNVLGGNYSLDPSVIKGDYNLNFVEKQEEFTWTKEALDAEIKLYQKRLDSQLQSNDLNEKDKAILEELKAKRQAINDLDRLRLEYAKQTAQIDIDTVTNATNKLLAEKELTAEKYKQATTFDRMFMNSKSLILLEANEAKNSIRNRQTLNRLAMQDLQYKIDEMLLNKDTNNLSSEDTAKKLMYEAEINRIKSEGAELELEWSKALTDEQLKRYELS